MMKNRILCILFGHKHFMLNIPYDEKSIVNDIMTIHKNNKRWLDIKLCKRCNSVYWEYS